MNLSIESLNDLTVVALQRLCVKYDLKVPKNASKSELIRHLEPVTRQVMIL